MPSYEVIKNTIKDSKRLVFYYDSKGKQLLVAKNKTEGREKLLKTKYQGIVYRLNITFHTGNKLGQGGPLAVRYAKFEVDDDSIEKIKDKQNGIVWFDGEWLETQRKWNEKWLDFIADDLVKGKKSGFGIDLYT